MSTADFDILGEDIALWGGWSLPQNIVVTGGLVEPMGDETYLASVFIGTQIELYAAGVDQTQPGAVFSVSIDGGTPVTVDPAPGNSFAYTMLATGLSDESHTLLVHCDAGTYIANVGTLRVSGASPAILTAIRMAASGDKFVVFDGDSRTAGKECSSGECDALQGTSYPARVIAALTEAGGANNGISGVTAQILAVNFNQNIGTQYNSIRSVNLLVFSGGINDLNSVNATTLEGYVSSYAASALTVGYKLIVCTIPPIGPVAASDYVSVNAQAAIYNAWLIENGEAFGIAVADVAAILDDPTDTSLYYTDQVHFTDAGYQVWANVVVPIVQSLLASLAATPTTVERGEPGQSITLSGNGIDFNTAVATDFTLTGSTVTAYSQSTFVLTFTATSSTGSLTLTHVPTGATCTLTCVDTTPPPNPTGVTGGTATLSGSTYSFSLSWASQIDTYGGFVTYRVYKNGVELTTAPGQSGHTYAITGAHLLDVFTVKAEDASSNISGATAYTFQIPIPTNVASTTYPVISVNEVDLGLITQIDQNQYQYINVQNIEEPVTVTITSPYSNCQIRYTLNGKIPNPSSHLYTGPLTFTMDGSGSEHTAIKARVYDLTNANNKSKIIRLAFRVVPSA